MPDKFKTKIGGQALIDGIMMRGPLKTCFAVRMKNGTIYTEISDSVKNPVAKIPVVRGIAAMIISLKSGYGYLMKSADLAYPDEKDTGGSALLSTVLAVLIAVGLFILLPTFLTGLLDKWLNMGGLRSVAEGIIKLLIFIFYIFTVTRMKEIHRVFEYHGAEHKTIFCYEAHEELTVENVRKHSRFHPRCGTSFLFIVILISIIISSFITWDSYIVRVLIKLLLLPVVIGLSYEIIQYAGGHDNLFCKILSAPGMFVQRFTAFEPDDSMIEVAIASLLPVIPENEEDGKW